MNILVLYSWEDNEEKSSEWALALCHELQQYEGIDATCDKLWHPESNTIDAIYNKISSADKLVVIVTQSYNDKIQKEIGVASTEEKIYRKIISDSNDKNKILFVLKEPEIILPQGWENFNREDLSKFNENEYKFLSEQERNELIENIVRTLTDTPKFKVNIERKKPIPKSKNVKSFESIYTDKKAKKQLTLKEQENRLIDYLQKNSEQESMVYDFLRSGVAADLNLNGRITSELFSEFFLVRRDVKEEENYTRTIQDVFRSTNHNMLCLQSDGGSGKSVFVHTMFQRLSESNRTNYNYNNVIFDLSNLHENSVNKEALIFQRLKKEYRQMVRSYKNNILFAKQWLNSFSEVVKSLNEVVFGADDSLFRINQFQEELNKVITQISPEKELNEENFEKWYFGFSKRIYKAKASVNESNILFIILLTMYMLILKCKPQIDKPDRYILVFDNIETYDNGELAKEIANYIHNCHSFIRKIFGELGESDLFYTKFTFVFVIRTSTHANFGNLQTDIWSGGRYVKSIHFFDFSVEAMLRKLKFLTKLKDYKDTLLFQEIYLIASIIIPPSALNDCLENGFENIVKYKHFTTHRLLPLFNNNYRKAIRYICDILTIEDTHNLISEKLKKANSMYDSLYDYSINGVRMVIIRNIFNHLQENGYLDIMGFSELTGNEEHSLTRTILSYLYWDEYKYVISNQKHTYKGVSLYTLINTFSYYCKSGNLSEILYGLSMYAYKNHSKKVALEAWGYLLTYTNVNIDLSEEEFKQIIMECYGKRQNIIYLQNTPVSLDKIYVKLSDAGMCFTQYYIRSFEFLLSRSRYDHNTPPLFMLKTEESIKLCIDDIYNIINNCINKLIGQCKNVCTLYGYNKETCIHNEGKIHDLSILSCSLFLRYQECIDLIRESIDYIDRFRIVYYNDFCDEVINNMLIDKISEYYGLYKILNDTLLDSSSDKCIESFLKNWQYPENNKYNLLVKTTSSDVQDKNSHKRIERIRPIQSYYVHCKENFLEALSIVRNKPRFSVYQIIEDML